MLTDSCLPGTRNGRALSLLRLQRGSRGYKSRLSIARVTPTTIRQLIFRTLCCPSPTHGSAGRVAPPELGPNGGRHRRRPLGREEQRRSQDGVRNG